MNYSNMGPFGGWNRQNSRRAPEDDGGPSPKSRRDEEPSREKAGAEGDWRDDPALKNMDLKKLAFLSELMAQSGGKSPEALLPFLMAANRDANSMGLQFDDNETELILKVLKSRMSPEEQSRIELFRKMAEFLGNKGR